MNVTTRSYSELIEELQNQLSALRSSCAGYDSGDFWEGPRLATVVYTLVNDGRSKSVSVLTQLGLRHKIKFVSYATPAVPGNLLSWVPLCFVEMTGDSARYVPALENGFQKPTRMLSFKDWWKEPVFENAAGGQLSRMNLVFALRSQDGGSHFDAELPITPYLELKNSGIGIGSASGKNIPNAHLATMRHIAFELKRSIDPFL